jgi:NADH-quinone oxidoreductase subunit I
MKSILKEILYAPYSIAKGLAVTFKHIFQRKVTIQYPEQKRTLPDNYRGVPSLPVDQKTGTDRCIACGACVRMCPEQVLSITSEVGEDKKRKLQDFKIDAARCMWCGLCVEVCPTNALVMSKEFELAADSREGMVFDREKMHELGGVFPPEPEKPEESDESEKPKESNTEGGTRE